MTIGTTIDTSKWVAHFGMGGVSNNLLGYMIYLLIIRLWLDSKVTVSIYGSVLDS